MQDEGHPFVLEMEGENAESKGLQGQNVKSFQNLVYKHNAKSAKSIKGIQEGHLVKVVGSSWFEVSHEGRVLGGCTG